MGYRWTTRETWWLITALVLLITVVILVPFVRREVQRRRVEAAIARFEANPSESTAHELDVLLANGIPTNGQGGRILRLIARPTLLTRSTYPVNRVPSVSIECRFPLRPGIPNDMDLPLLDLKTYIQMEGQEKPTDDYSMGAYILSYQPLLLRCGTSPLPAGIHRGRVYIDWSVTHTEWHAPVWERLQSLLHGHHLEGGTPRQVRSYKAHFEIPLEITVVETSDAEQVALVSDPTLDEAVRRSFTCRRQDGLPLATDPRTVAYNGLTGLVWKNVPIALAFEPVLRLSDGREFSNRSRQVREVGRFSTRLGDSGVFYCWLFMTQALIEAPGQYEGTIVLRADPNIAYDDPAIKAIWGGTLEFPISFSVYEVSPGQ